MRHRGRVAPARGRPGEGDMDRRGIFEPVAGRDEARDVRCERVVGRVTDLVRRSQAPLVEEVGDRATGRGDRGVDAIMEMRKIDFEQSSQSRTHVLSHYVD